MIARLRILQRGGKRVFRCQPIVRQAGFASRQRSQLGQHRTMGTRRPKHIATAMEIQNDAPMRCLCRLHPLEMQRPRRSLEVLPIKKPFPVAGEIKTALCVQKLCVALAVLPASGVAFRTVVKPNSPNAGAKTSQARFFSIAAQIFAAMFSPSNRSSSWMPVGEVTLISVK